MLPVGELLLEFSKRPLLCVDERRPVGVNSARPCVASPVTLSVSRSSMLVRPLATGARVWCARALSCRCGDRT